MVALLSVILVFSTVILVHELGHFFMARRMGVKVERFSLGLGMVLWSKKIGETEYAISLIPFGGYIKMAGEEPSDKREGKAWEFYAKSPGRRFWILVAGASLNYLFAFLVFCFILPTSRVGMVLEDMPAYGAGIKTGDKILSIDGKKVRYWFQVLDIVSDASTERPLNIELDREGQAFAVGVVPELIESKGLFGRSMKRAKIGIGYYGDVQLMRGNPLSYLRSGAQQTFSNTVLTYRFIWYLVTGKVSVKGSVTGPVGIAVILGKASRMGFINLLYIVGHINLALAIFNLLPFPVLDGGHIMFLGLERLRGRALDIKVQERVQYVAVALLVTFFLFVSYNDLTLWIFKK